MVQNSVLDKLTDDNISAYVVWTPVLKEDDRTTAGKSIAFVNDRRATHFWDGDKSLGMAFGQLVTLPRNRELAWDVYFVFDEQSKWTDTPPKPTEWMHQLGLDDRALDGDRLRLVVEEMLPIE